MSTTVPPSRTGRVLVIDPDGRVLLLAEAGGPAGRTVWLTPGGGVDASETVMQAARRELREEVGLAVSAADLAGPVAIQTRLSSMDGASREVTDAFYLIRVEAFEPDMSGLTEFERGLITGHRWWSIAALETTTDEVYPDGLAQLLRRLQRSGVPDEPWIMRTSPGR